MKISQPKLVKHQQLDLFASSNPSILPSSSSNLLLSENSLIAWKQKLSTYQQDIREQNLHQQQALFNIERSSIDRNYSKVWGFTIVPK